MSAVHQPFYISICIWTLPAQQVYTVNVSRHTKNDSLKAVYHYVHFAHAGGADTVEHAPYSHCVMFSSCDQMPTWLRYSKPIRFLKLHLHTAINRTDFVFWWMWFNGSPTKVQRHFLTNAFCYLHTYITCTKIRMWLKYWRCICTW